jgi:hypothetical protein
MYYSPSVTFDRDGEDSVAALLKYIKTKSCSHGKIAIACASAGSAICWGLANNKEAVANLSGIMIVGGAGGPNYEIKESAAVAAKLPIAILHGERDNSNSFEQIYNNIKKNDPKYPARYVVFKNGLHGTPIRMIDWRDTLNCLFSQSANHSSSKELPLNKQNEMEAIHNSH